MHSQYVDANTAMEFCENELNDTQIHHDITDGGSNLMNRANFSHWPPMGPVGPG